MDERDPQNSEGEERKEALNAWKRLLQLHGYTEEEISLLADKFTDDWLRGDGVYAALENIRAVAVDFWASQTPSHTEEQ